jgi:hypothetical protein
MPPYNGHRSWNAWNVALWIANDEPLYRFAMSCLQTAKNLSQATRYFMAVYGGCCTPDGATYNATCVREALAGLND